MADAKWTPEQEKAINTKGKSLIVSAAAGSGKTSVLVERIVKMICAEENPVSVDRLLIVTFTRAAANEMRQRLAASLEKRIQDDPDNRFLLRQQSLLPLADICTMDQFFNSLVKENFQQLGITPDFRIIDSGEAQIFKHESIQEALEYAYENENADFEKLLCVLGCDKNDDVLAECIEKLNTYANAYPYPEKWLNNISECYNSMKLPQNTVFGEVLLDKVKSYSSYAIKQLENAKELLAGVSGGEKAYALIGEELIQAESVYKSACMGEWNEVFYALRNLTFERWSVKKECKDLYECKYAQRLRNSAKSLVSSLSSDICATQEEFCEDERILGKIIPQLIDIILCVREKYAQKKKSVNALEFDDITHLALELLVKDGELTDIALELREKYDEILIDEYQDTNSIQDTVFSALSKDEKNLFIVGDVKQSIYGFRLAMPEIFIDRINRWKNSEDDEKQFVNLDRNFRSRKPVLDAVNYLFEKIMNEKAGNIVYDETQTLKSGAEYPESKDPNVEFYVLDKSQIKEEYTEIEFVADKIEEILKTGQVYDRKLGEMRQARAKDICVLLRKNKHGPNMLRELKARGISSYFEDNSGFFANTEVSVMLSFLSVIDNPLQDVPLLAVLMSCLFGFSAEDTAKLRIESRKGKLYYALRKSENAKCKNFIKEYDEYKKLSSAVSVSELLRTVYERTGYLSVVSAMNNGEVRKLNLMLLLEYAQNYEQFGKNGLSGFMRYIDLLKKNKADLKPAVSVSENADVVRIMTVHKSKGLEFPIVILCETESKAPPRSKDLVVNRKTGIGLKITDKPTFKKYSTVEYEATKYAQTLEDCSEELRALYVALTRAKERLIITGEVENFEKTAQAVSVNCFQNKIDSVAAFSNSGFFKYMLMGFMRHSDAGKLRYYADYQGDFDAVSDFKMKFEVVSEKQKKTVGNKSADNLERIGFDEETVKKIRERTEYEYEYMPLSELTTKMSASSFNLSKNQNGYSISEVPSFAKKNKLSAAEKGTAMHRFMEVCDFTSAKESIKKEKERLKSEGKLTPEQAESLDEKLLAEFFESELYSRIMRSDKVMREQKFTVFLPVSAIGEEFSEIEGEKILVQGVIDCAFYEDGELVVIDYKSDKVKDFEELKNRYRRQLEVYKIAAQQTFCTKVKELAIYSFYLGEEKMS